MTVQNENVWGVPRRNIASANLGSSNVTLEYEDAPLLHETNLDAYVNVVVSANTFSIINDTNRWEEASTFTLDYKSSPKVPIVDATIRCDFSLSSKTFLLMVKSTLSATSMNHNVMLQLNARETWVAIRCAPKIQCKNPEETYSSVFLKMTMQEYHWN